MTHTATDSDPFWTVAEIAEQLRVSKMTVYRLADEGEFPGTIRGGRSFRIPDSGLQAYLAACRVDGAASTS